MTTSVKQVGLLTARDREIALWLSRVGGATMEQLQRRFRLGRSQAYRRLQVLGVYGLVRWRRILAERPAVYAVPAQRLRAATFEHLLAVAELVVERELSGARIVTEAELLRARAERAQLAFGVADDELSAALACRRLPDAVEVRSDGGLWAYEVELSSKGRRRREAILAAYAASEYRRVVWIVPEPRVRALIRAGICELGLSELMEVRGEVPKEPR